MKLAVIVRAAFMVTTQMLPDVESQPDQLEKEDPEFGCAVSVTVVPTEKLALHVEVGQAMPVGELVTTPDPAPPIVTVRLANWEQFELPFKRMAKSAVPLVADPAARLAGLLYTVAKICPEPQMFIAVAKPVALTVTPPGESVAQVTALVMSLLSGGWM